MLLAYALARFIDFPLSNLSLQLPGLFLSLQINLRTLVTLLVAGQAAAGAAWLIQKHPAAGQHFRPEHYMIPTLTAWVIGTPLFQIPLGFLWWAGFLLGGTILTMVMIAEYIVVDPDDARQPLASAGLTVVSFALYLILAASLRYANLRLFLILPALTLAAGLICLRTLHLRLHGKWALLQTGILMLLVGQLIAALHYWPIPPVSYALALLGAAYSLTNLLGSLADEKTLQQAWIEPVVMLVIFWAAAVLVR